MNHCFKKKPHCVKSVEKRSIFWSVFSRIRTKNGEILRNSSYSVRMRKNTDQNKLRIWTLFTQCLRNEWLQSYNLNIISLQQFFIKFRSSHRRCSMKKGVLKNFVKFKGKYLYLFALKIGSDTGVFLWILWNFWEYLSYRTPPGDCFCQLYLPKQTLENWYNFCTPKGTETSE